MVWSMQNAKGKVVGKGVRVFTKSREFLPGELSKTATKLFAVCPKVNSTTSSTNTGGNPRP